MKLADPSTLRQETLAIFVEAVLHYFTHVTRIPVVTETPYLKDGTPEMHDITAVIGISGDLQGAVYYTAPRSMLDQLLASAGEPNPTDDLRCDMAGEVANTLSGNARRHLGSGFMISVPVVIQGKPERLMWPKGTACFVIPVLWKETRSLLTVCLAPPSPTSRP